MKLDEGRRTMLLMVAFWIGLLVLMIQREGKPDDMVVAMFVATLMATVHESWTIVRFDGGWRNCPACDEHVQTRNGKALDVPRRNAVADWDTVYCHELICPICDTVVAYSQIDCTLG